MQCAPPVHRILDDRDVDHADQRQDRGRARTAVTAGEGATQHDHAQIQEQLDQHRGQPGIPDPPGAPGGNAPHRAGKQRQRRHQGTDGRGGRGDHVRQLDLPYQEEERAHRQQHEARLGENRRRHMHIDDAEAVALLVVGGREGQPPDTAGHQRDDRQGPEPRQPALAGREEGRRCAHAMQPRP